MSLANVGRLLRKDLQLGPRSPIFLWVLVLPFLITFVVQVVFGSLFEVQPRLGIVDLGSSTITSSIEAMEGIDLIILESATDLRDQVEANDLDAGLVLEPGFDAAVAAGDLPLLEFFVGGESLASDRIVLAVTTLDLVRQLEGRAAPVTVEIVELGESIEPIAVRLVPFVVIYALLIAGVFLPAFGLADEREKQTLEALTVTPVSLAEVVVAKAVLGFTLAVAMAFVTLWLNDAWAAEPLALTVVLLVAGIMLVEVGVIYGTASKNVTGVFTLIKGTGVILLGPTIFYIFPSWPQWIAKLFPTYWVINPVHEVTINDAGLGAVAGELIIGGAIIVLLIIPIWWLVHSLDRRIALSG